MRLIIVRPRLGLFLDGSQVPEVMEKYRAGDRANREDLQ
jgi:hypothetical protein